MATSPLSSEQGKTPEVFLEEGDISIQLRGLTPALWSITRVTGSAQPLWEVSAGHLASSWLQQLCPLESEVPKGNTERGRP